MVSNCKEMQQEYTGNNNDTRHLNPPYLLSNFDELNIYADSMKIDELGCVAEAKYFFSRICKNI